MSDPRSSFPLNSDPDDTGFSQGVPDPATDPVTGPVVRRLERFIAATFIEPPDDIAARVRGRLAGEPRPAPMGAAPWSLLVTRRTGTDTALGRERVPVTRLAQGSRDRRYAGAVRRGARYRRRAAAPVSG